MSVRASLEVELWYSDTCRAGSGQPFAVPMLVFPRRIEHAFDVAVHARITPIRRASVARCVLRPAIALASRPAILASRSALGSLVMALRRVAERTSGFRPYKTDRIENR